MHSSNPESMVPSISPYINTSGKLMAKMVVGAAPCVCPDCAACALILIVPPVPTVKRMGSLPTEHAI